MRKPKSILKRMVKIESDEKEDYINKPNGGFPMIVKCSKSENMREYGNLPSKMQMKLAIERRNKMMNMLKRQL